MAIKICFAFLSDQMGPGNVNDLINHYILPIRPDRTYARKLRFQVMKVCGPNRMLEVTERGFLAPAQMINILDLFQ